MYKGPAVTSDAIAVVQGYEASLGEGPRTKENKFK